MAAVGSSNNHFLTLGGFTKIPLDKQSQTENGQKIRLYHLENPTEEKIEKAKEAILKVVSLKHREYVGDLDDFDLDIREEPYLIRQGQKLFTLSEEEVFKMLGDYSVALQKRNLALELPFEAGKLFSAGKIEDALNMYAECLELNREMHDQTREAGTLFNMGEVLASDDQYEMSIVHYLKCVAILETIKTNESFGALVYRGLGFAYQQCGNKNLAHMYYSHYKEICADKNNQLGVREAQDLIQSLEF